MMKRLEQNLASGGNIGLLVFLLWGSLVLVGLFLSVHSRDIIEPQQELQGRWSNVIHLWENEGYFAQGGLWFSKSLIEDPAQTMISPYTMGFLQGAHLLERFKIWLDGSFSLSLLAIHNQLIPMFSSALLGFLAMRLTLPLGIRPVHAYVLGLSSQTMYQTFPSNLWFFWEIYPTTMFIFFMALFLVCEVSKDELKSENKSFPLMRSFSIFCMVFVEWVGALGFLSAYCLVSRLPSLGNKIIKMEMAKIALPVFLAFIVMAGQLLWVKVSYPDAQLIGEGVGSQIGLDKSFLQDKELTRVLKKRYDSLLPDWNVLFATGFLATFVVMAMIWREKKNFSHFIILATGIGFYSLFLLFNPKSFILPEAYGVYLAFTLILALFALLPGWLETFNNNSGIFVLTFFVLSFCWSCIQLRNYSLYYPL
ncbi:MAG: hypothetical protein HN472_10370 [Nitrospina sp.]|jgi:hypothetical protein|nr:hypothetical protein [Nitrospina sp.]MBT3874438.1 hypothetical protein [Nitrospina sp.]MBT4049070.1 hypothetical protein [Nitrospina sp.]MBT4559108.1 hypothetical protein [Nitrospina sp.]MBT5347774.1 hypothetical protein [Nitrospina sp.]